jgi:exodeoxyribonuclease V alpha subunit
MSTVDALLREGWLRPVDHALALSLRRLRPDTAEEVLLGAALASRALAFGHSGVPLAQAGELLLEIAPEHDAPPSLPTAATWTQALQGSPWVALAAPGRADDGATPLVLEAGRLYLRRYWRYECRLAAALAARAAASTPEVELSPPLLARWQALFPAASGAAPDAQADAARRLLGARLLLLTGGPGTGKTTTVARMLQLAQAAAAARGDAPLRCALAAPTGKAAARLAEAVQAQAPSLASTDVAPDPAAAPAAPAAVASTLHRLLGWRGDGEPFRHDAAHPLPYDLVVVDEASMVDLPLMAKLVDAVAPEATLLLVGDRDQLPSVETGDVLAALCDAADQGGPLAAQRIALQRSWRQDATIDVPSLAAQVRDGAVAGILEGLQAQRYRGVEWLAPERLPAAMLVERARAAFAPLGEAGSPAEALRAAQRFRVLTALREGPSGSQAINAALAQALRPAGRGEGLFHGALLIVTRNSYRHGLFNGDIGIAWRERDADGSARLQVWFERGDGRLQHWSPAALPPHELAFALTVHKSQGSEFDQVLLLLPPAGAGGASRALSRELLYTGLTRCRQGLVLCADRASIHAAVMRPAQRWSGLATRLA